MLDPSDEIADIEFSEEDVDTLLTKLKDNKSPGVDNIHPAMLKNLHSELKKPLYLLFRKSLDEGTVPNDWKMANVAPIHKKGNKKLTSNFRPVSLTSMVGKLLERLINQAIMSPGLAGGIYRRYLPPVFTGKYRHGQYSQKWRLPAFTGIYKYFISFSSNYIVDSPSYLLYYTWTP